MKTKFCEVELGARFTFCGLDFLKSKADMAVDEEGIEHVFMAETVVEAAAPPGNWGKAECVEMRS